MKEVVHVRSKDLFSLYNITLRPTSDFSRRFLQPLEKSAYLVPQLVHDCVLSSTFHSLLLTNCAVVGLCNAWVISRLFTYTLNNNIAS